MVTNSFPVINVCVCAFLERMKKKIFVMKNGILHMSSFNLKRCTWLLNIIERNKLIRNQKKRNQGEIFLVKNGIIRCIRTFDSISIWKAVTRLHFKWNVRQLENWCQSNLAQVDEVLIALNKICFNAHTFFAVRKKNDALQWMQIYSANPQSDFVGHF